MNNDATHPAPPPTPRHQRGVALVVSMMMLVAITLIGVAVMNSSRLEWLMAANSALQTSAYTQAEAALIAGEQAIISNTCTGNAPVPPDANNCRPAVFNWSWADQLFSTSTELPAAQYWDPLNVNPRLVTTWTAGFGAAAPGGGRYAVLYRGCTLVGPGGPCNNPGGATDVMSTFTYEVWGYGSDGQGAARIVQSTYVMLVNWSSNPVALGSDAPLRRGTCLGAPGQPCNPDNYTEFRRVGYVEINS